jgi:hypothetical protein
MTTNLQQEITLIWQQHYLPISTSHGHYDYLAKPMFENSQQARGDFHQYTSKLRIVRLSKVCNLSTKQRRRQAIWSLN